MIEAKHSKLANFMFDRYIMRLLNHSFNSFYTLNECPQTISRFPVLLIPNHSTWWDGFFIYMINRFYFNRHLYIMMLERQLKRYPFFRRVGAFSIDPEQKKEIRRSLEYTLELMKITSEPAPLITLFPQGELLPWALRPLNFKKGLAWIISHYPHRLNLIPVVLRIEYQNEQKANVFFKFGENHICDKYTFAGTNDILEKKQGIRIM